MEEKKTLENIEILKGLSGEELEKLASKCEWKSFEIDEVVFDETSSTDEVYFIVSGMVKAATDAPGVAKEDAEVSLATIQSGDYFGELSAIDGKARSARIVAMEHTRMAILKSVDFVELMENSPSVAMHVLHRFAAIIRRLDNRVAELSTLSDSERIFSELVRLAIPDSNKMNNAVIPNMPKHQELASWTGTSRETVAKVIGELARTGIVERRSLKLIVNDFSKLQLMARPVGK